MSTRGLYACKMRLDSGPLTRHYHLDTGTEKTVKTVLASGPAVGYSLRAMSSLALTELLGLPVFEPSGGQCGRVRELAVAPQEDRARIAVMIVRTKSGDRVMPFSAVHSINGGLRIDSEASAWPIADGSEGLFLLARDLLDQQIIDVHGR
jgi:hypothetical protein